ncbi:DUF1749-domain-containing protein [Piedraia hortae CBS 480.64]|uniref:DUF1749-domain-containing protein n=1 Tax=Piedraia hortae CBS 480.64 TaxID=1314780 RepID=A0A6A7BR88_9PEZI|nr:DUF1749-domain-containing protein [Piedraia hortae CBS 480.64]
MLSPPASANAGTLHYIPARLSAFELGASKANTLIWIAGLGDTQLFVDYPKALSTALALSNWSVAIANLHSTGLGWGISSISRDANDLSKIVAYFRSHKPGGKIVLMGHSTGCQDCMEYLLRKNETVEGVILQAPVSDREAMAMGDQNLVKEANEAATRMNPEDVLPHRLTRPLFGRVAISARRWLDLSSPEHNGADDFFSSDLSDEQLENTFGSIKTPLLILYSGKDENVPDFVDKEALVQRWLDIVRHGDGEAQGRIIPSATHNLNGSDRKVVGELVNFVVSFLHNKESRL